MTLFMPSYTYEIPVHVGTHGSEILRLAVEKHSFPPPASKPSLKIAFLWTHGTGFHKEMLHPLMRRFSDQLRPIPRYDNVHFDFFAWDHRYHGDSAMASKDAALPHSVSWYEVALDVVQVIDHFQIKQQYDMVIGIGHSLGGTSMLLAEYMFPNTFDSICAIDPVMRDRVLDHKTSTSMTPERLTLQRRDTWPNRAICLHWLRSRPFWSTWDGEVLENFVNHGLYGTEEGTVKLKCPKEFEHLFYVFGPTPHDSFCYFLTLRELTIPVHMVLASDISVDSIIRASPENIDKQSAMVSTAVIEGTHMLPFENPAAIVPELIQFTDNLCQNFFTKSKL